MGISQKLLSLALSKKCVLLDLDNTVYKYDPCHQQAMDAVFSEYRKICEPVSRTVFDREYKKAQKQVKGLTKKQAASHSRLLYFQALLENRFNCTCYEETLRLEKLYWQTFMKSMRLEKWVLPFLTELKKQRIPVVIVTDLTAEIQMKKIKKLGLIKWTHALVSSEEAGVEKPDKRIFMLALKKVNCNPRQALLVGDGEHRDTCPGITTFRV